MSPSFLVKILYFTSITALEHMSVLIAVEVILINNPIRFQHPLIKNINNTLIYFD